MPKKALRPICFIAMPFGKKTPPGKHGSLVDFDRIYSHIGKGAKTRGGRHFHRRGRHHFLRRTVGPDSSSMLLEPH